MRAVYFKIKPDGILYVSSPIQYKSTIESIILTKSDWIINHISLLSLKYKLITEDTVMFLGNPLPTSVEPIVSGKQHFCLEGGKFILRIKDPIKMRIWLDYFLKKLTQDYIQHILPEWVTKTGLSPKQIRYRKMKKWGACTKKGTLIFNSYLICLPSPLIAYIVCHELIHLKHFDHSRNFHIAVATFLPHVKNLEKELKMYVR